MSLYNFIVLEEDTLLISYTKLSNRRIYPFIGVCKKDKISFSEHMLFIGQVVNFESKNGEFKIPLIRLQKIHVSIL